MLADALQLDVQPILAAGPQPVVVPAAVTVFQTQVELYRQLQMMHALDRKSTRLNSSHLVISYAVFCLKKKIKSIRESQSPTGRIPPDGPSAPGSTLLSSLPPPSSSRSSAPRGPATHFLQGHTVPDVSV